MNTFDSLEDRVLVSPRPRKRGRSTEYHDREKKRNIRHSGGGKIPQVNCTHSARDNANLCHADTINHADLALNHAKFYGSPDKVAQDAFILSLMNISEPKRRRVQDGKLKKHKDITVKYTLLSETKHPKKIKVCKKTFLSVFGISKDRPSRIAQYYTTNAEPRPENRGGLRNADEVSKKRDQVKAHIQTFTCRASHYGRRGAPGRKYLPSDLSVRRMHELFKQQNHDQVSYSLYYSILTRDFNLGFGHPATDSCATCTKHGLSMKDPSLTDEDKRTKAAMFILHRRRARVFYDQLGIVDPTALTICFDMMQNMALPRTSIGQAYYSRQLYLYLFGVVVHHGKDSEQNRNDVHLYVWMENENKKDSNMIASALDDCLRVRLKGTLRQKDKLRLFSDSCFGQNKNMNVLSMLCALRKSIGHEVGIEFTFPIRGHSFLPADRVFGRIEQMIRKHDTILHPNGYYDILRKHGNLYIYGVDWNAQDFKSETQNFVKVQRSFRLSDARMLSITSDKIGFKTTYAAEYCYHSVLKRGKQWTNFKPKPLEMVSTVKAAKKTDVENLLAEIGAPPDIMDYYRGALSSAGDNNTEPDSDGNSDS